VAKSLLRRFGTFEEVIAAPVANLTVVEHVNVGVVTLIKAVSFAIIRAARTKMEAPNSVAKIKGVRSYLATVLVKAGAAQYRVLHFDARGRMIADDVTEGAIGVHPSVYPRELIIGCLNRGTARIILGTYREGRQRAEEDRLEKGMIYEIRSALKQFAIKFDGLFVLSENGFRNRLN